MRIKPGYLKDKQFIKKILISFIALLLVLFIFRSPLIKLIINSRINRFNETHHAELHIGKLHMKGFLGVRIDELFLKPVIGDTLFRAGTIVADFNLRTLLGGKLSLKALTLCDAALTIKWKDSTNNYSFLSRYNQEGKQSSSDSITAYDKRCERILSMIFDIIPSRVNIRNFTISSKTPRLLSSFHIKKMTIRKNGFSLYVLQKNDRKDCDWITAGYVDKSNKEIHLRCYPAQNNKVIIPFIREKFGAYVAMDTLHLNFSSGQSKNNILPLFCSFSVKGLKIKHRRISADEVGFDKLLVSLNINIGDNYIEIDSSSELGFNKLLINPYLRYRKELSKEITLRLDKRDCPAADLFESLPEGLFANFKGFSSSGKLSYHLYFDADLKNPDSLVFESDLRCRHFIIKSFGISDLTRMNNSFEYTAYEKGEPVASFIVGPENPNYISLDRISLTLKNAVMTSEDAFFYQHRGFIMESIKEAIATDIREKRFARGGSTITMQLVKNVFLNRNKTIARKLEEALIVWLIENCALTSKERMFEVYLNIIEWGPGIYGIQAASHFYFNKKPLNLSLPESVFLASIIPRPKWFMYCFNPDGSLKDYESNALKRITERMVKYNFIPPEDTAMMTSCIKLTGRAKDLLKTGDTIHPDTLIYQEMIF